MGVTVYFGKRKGSASTADLSARAVSETVEKACDIARYTAEDDCSGLADPDELARDIPDLDLDHPWDISPEAGGRMRARLRSRGPRGRHAHHQFRRRDCRQPPGCARIRQLARLSRRLPVHQPQHQLRAAGAGRRRHAARLLVQLGARRARPGIRARPSAARRASAPSRGLRARKLTTQRARVLFAPEVARGLIGHFLGAVRGSSQYRKSSFLLGAAGQQVFPVLLRVARAAAHPQGPGQHARSTAKASRRATATWCRTACCRVTCSAVTRRASWVCKTTGNAGGNHNLLVESKTGGLSSRRPAARARHRAAGHRAHGAGRQRRHR